MSLAWQNKVITFVFLIENGSLSVCKCLGLSANGVIGQKRQTFIRSPEGYKKLKGTKDIEKRMVQ